VSNLHAKASNLYRLMRWKAGSRAAGSCSELTERAWNKPLAGADSPMTVWSIPTILADFLHGSLNSVEVVPNLPVPFPQGDYRLRFYGHRKYFENHLS
jgi:hypothetical protein